MARSRFSDIGDFMLCCQRLLAELMHRFQVLMLLKKECFLLDLLAEGCHSAGLGVYLSVELFLETFLLLLLLELSS